MARRAVQGFPEKSYYENTRYAGVLATNDALNEGYFRQLVNLRISDTGQSLEPRKGFLMTTLASTEGAISLSENCLVFRDEKLNKHIVYDYNNNTGYIVDINTYNLSNNMVMIEHIITNYDWSSVKEFLNTNYFVNPTAVVQSLIEYKRPDSYWEGINYDIGYHVSSVVFDDIEKISIIISDLEGGIVFNFTELIYNSTQSFNYYYFENIHPTLSDYVHDIVFSYNINSTTKALTLTLSAMRVDAVNGEMNINLTFFQGAPIEEEEIVEYVTIGTQTTQAINEYMIENHLFPLTFVNEGVLHKHIGEVYYRQDAVTIGDEEHLGDTLVFNVVNTQQHPTIAIAERNLACLRPLVPEEPQKFFTEENRPNGVVNFLETIFVKHSEKYYLLNLLRNVDYKLIPYFNVIPAHEALNRPVEDKHDCAWAFRFSVTTKDKRYFSAWYKYRSLGTPQKIFNRDSMTDLNTSNKSDRMYKGARHVIYVLPLGTSPTIYNAEILDHPAPSTYPNLDSGAVVAGNLRYNDWIDKYNNWNKKSLRDLIVSLGGNARFYVYRFEDQEDYSNSNRLGADYLTSKAFVHLPVVNSETDLLPYHKYALSSTEIVQLFDDEHFEQARVALKYFPFVGKGTLTYDVQGESFSGWTYFFFPGNYEHSGSRVFANLDTINIASTSSEDIPISYKHDNKIQIYMEDIERLTLNNVGNELAVGFYLRPYHIDDTPTKVNEIETTETIWMLSSLNTERLAVFSYNRFDVSTYPMYTLEDTKNILDYDGFIVYDRSRIVLWKKNILYISEPGHYYYFKEFTRKTFGERIVKVLQFKTVLLVFTVQHLYAVYETEIEIVDSVDTKEDNVTVRKQREWAMHCTLYNIFTNEKYKDAIQVFNQMVLFYSEDGQMFMIKPNVMIDSDTQFSLHYFNKSANDILLNYHLYINERLKDYNIDREVTQDEVSIKVLISVNNIKIFYTVPGLITYILVYDVLNNRYYMDDTMLFNNIRSLGYTESGEMYLTIENEKMFITQEYQEPNIMDNYVDMSYTNNFKRIPINALIDAGNINLNNHLMKRFRDLHIVFRNLSTNKVLISVMPMLDGVLSRMIFENRLEVKDINGASYFVYLPKHEQNALLDLVEQSMEADKDRLIFDLNNPLFEEQNMLLDFEQFNSSKYLTHRSSILGMGKVLRLRMLLVSKGRYKIISYGIVFKERRI
jgi:hypothetical protein